MNTIYLTSSKLAGRGRTVLVAFVVAAFSCLSHPALGAALGFMVKVEDASGTAVPGAAVCIGTSLDRAQYGAATTDAWGNASFTSISLDTAFYVTANKNGHGTEHYVANTSVVPVETLFLTLQLPASTTEPACPGSSSWDLTPGIEIDPENLFPGQIFEILLMLDQPPPTPVPMRLESSRPDLIALPAEVTFRRGEQKKVLKVRVASRVSRAASVDVRGGIGKDPKKTTRKTVYVRPRSKR